MKAAVAILALLLAACGGGGDDSAPVQTPSGPFVSTIAQRTDRESQSVTGPSVSEFKLTFLPPPYNKPAAGRVEICVDLEVVIQASADATITHETAMRGAVNNDAVPGADFVQLTAGQRGARRAVRCEMVAEPADPAAPFAILVRIMATAPAMARYEALVRWNVKSIYP